MKNAFFALAFVLALAGLSHSQDFEQRKMLEKVRACVVALRNDQGHGSGMILDEQGTILTNAHVIVSPLPMRVEAEVKVRGELRTVFFSKVTLIGVHPVQDLAIVRIDPAEHKAELLPIPIAKNSIMTGETIHAIGFPSSLGGFQKFLTSGEVKGVNQFVDAPGYFEFSARVHPGNSGGPICDTFGHAVGVVTQTMSNGDPVAWAIPLNNFRPDLFIPLDRRAKDPAKASVYLRFAEQMLKKGEQGSRPDALLSGDLFHLALLEDISNADTYFKIGMIARAGGKFKVAASYLARSIQIQPWSETRQTPYHEMGVALFELGKVSEAVVVWNEGLAKFPTDAGQIWDALAIYHFGEGRYYEAACATRSSLRAFGPRAEAMNSIYDRSRKRMEAEGLVKLRAYESSLEENSQRTRKEVEKARQEGKKSLTPAFDGFLRTYEGLQKEATDFNFRSLGQGPNGPKETPIPDADLVPLFIQSRVAVAREHLKSGRIELATQIFEEVIKSYPDHPEAEDARIYLAVIRKK